MHFFLLITLLTTVIQSTLSVFLTANIPEDGRLNFTELATKYGHSKTVEYDVHTQDGYVLQMFHVPGDQRRPVLVLHGILGSSDDFIVRGNASLIVQLANAQYDVWAANVRGNRYSRRHTHLDPDTDDAFWDYGLDELALNDLPAMIDFVLNKTEETSIAAIAYSEGTAMFYALAAEKPEYNDKVNILISLAPACYLNYIKEPLMTIAKFSDVINAALKVMGVEEIQGYHSGAKKLQDVLCTQGQIGYFLCMKVGYFVVSGGNDEEMEMEFQRVLQGHIPAGTSRKNVYHMAQLATSGRFSKFDYGLKNLEYYGSLVPPEYDVGRVRMKVALLAGAGDKIATVESVAMLRNRLPNVVHFEVLEPKMWSHLDFVFARNGYKYMFPTIFKLLDEYGP